MRLEGVLTTMAAFQLRSFAVKTDFAPSTVGCLGGTWQGSRWKQSKDAIRRKEKQTLVAPYLQCISRWLEPGPPRGLLLLGYDLLLVVGPQHLRNQRR